MTETPAQKFNRLQQEEIKRNSNTRLSIREGHTMQSHSNIPLHIVPAYGRDYSTSLEVLAAWKAGHDFRIADISSPWDGCYCSCRDFTRIERVMLRFNKLADFVITGGLKPRTLRTFVPPTPKRTAAQKENQ